MKNLNISLILFLIVYLVLFVGNANAMTTSKELKGSEELKKSEFNLKQVEKFIESADALTKPIQAPPVENLVNPTLTQLLTSFRQQAQLVELTMNQSVQAYCFFYGNTSFKPINDTAKNAAEPWQESVAKFNTAKSDFHSAGDMLYQEYLAHDAVVKKCVQHPCFSRLIHALRDREKSILEIDKTKVDGIKNLLRNQGITLWPSLGQFRSNFEQIRDKHADKLSLAVPIKVIQEDYIGSSSASKLNCSTDTNQ